MGRRKTYLVAIALALGLTGAQAQSAPHESLGPKGVLTAERQQVLSEALTKSGREVPLSAAVATALGLSNGSEIKIVQIATKAKEDGHYHVYYLLPSGDILLSIVDTEKARNYRLDAHLRLVEAVTAIESVPTVIPVSDAQITVEEELRYWAGIADQLKDAK